MGSNRIFTIFEGIVIKTYDRGVLDKELLSFFMEQYRDTDIDSGGKKGLKSKNGLEVEQIVILIFNGKLPIAPNLPDHNFWTEEHERQDKEYDETISKTFRAITDQFGWF